MLDKKHALCYNTNKSTKEKKMLKKNHFQYAGKTGIAVTKGFRKKRLADYAVNIGSVCEFGCSFCYVPAVVTKQAAVQAQLEKGLAFDDFSLYRPKENVLKAVEKDLPRLAKEKGVVFFCTTCDPCATEEHAETTAAAARLILTKTPLQARILSKSVLIKKAAAALSDLKDRIIYGISTGTADPAVADSIETNASPLSERLAAVHWLQDNGFRVFGMLCPVIPSEIETIGTLVDAIRAERCENIWAEPINLRGKSFEKTHDTLVASGLTRQAEVLSQDIRNEETHQKYSEALYFRLKEILEQKNILDKFVYLHYLSGKESDTFKKQKQVAFL
jgi:DNA repair photolyase